MKAYHLHLHVSRKLKDQLHVKIQEVRVGQFGGQNWYNTIGHVHINQDTLDTWRQVFTAGCAAVNRRVTLGGPYFESPGRYGGRST